MPMLSDTGTPSLPKKEVHIPNLPQVASHQLYRAMDELLTVQSELEHQVFHAVADLLNLEVDLLYFDTTSSYFEIDPSEAPEEESFRKQGFSKDKRPDLLQIVIGLAVTWEGIPIRAWVWPGNTMDMTVIKQVKKDLIGWKLGRVISVMDRGFSSEAAVCVPILPTENICAN
jgi:transposase